MKIFLLSDMDGKIIGISEDKKAVELFMQQNGLDPNFYTITKRKGEEGDILYREYGDTKGIVYVSARDIVAQGRHADAVFNSISTIRYEMIETVNNLEYFSQLNLSENDKLALMNARRLLKRLSLDDTALEDAMKETIIFYLSRESNTMLRDIAFNEGKDY